MRRPLIAAALCFSGLLALDAAPRASASVPAPASCADLARLALPDVHDLKAVEVDPDPNWKPEPGARSAPVRAPFCRVQGVIEKEIAFELWLPRPAAWNGKFLGAGVGADAGTFNFLDLPRGVGRGYAAGTTDTGHKITDQAWMMGDPARLMNYQLRANHLLAEVSKSIVAAYYGRKARKAYFVGCSGGGRQGLKEAERFPADYDAIIAGAPGPKTPEMTTRRMWELLLRDARPGLMAPADWKLIADEGVRQCDPLDGVVDGVAEDPRRCRFDVRALQCKGARTDRCLSAEQVAFAARFYAPMKDSKGHAIDAGLLPGVLVDSGRSHLAIATFGQALRHDPDWNGKDFDAGRDLAGIRKLMPELAADQTDLSAFSARGGKLIVYQGWLDPAVAARMTVGWYQDVSRTMGAKRQARFMRLFMAPGVFHCAGGPGPDRFGGSGGDAPVVDPDHDLLSALERWDEQGVAPERVIASKLDAGKVVRTRPLCAFPAQARYTGKGSSDDAANFRCLAPKTRK